MIVVAGQISDSHLITAVLTHGRGATDERQVVVWALDLVGRRIDGCGERVVSLVRRVEIKHTVRRTYPRLVAIRLDEALEG